MPAISALIKPASGNCNMNCDYCFYCDETSKREVKSYGLMSEDTLRNVIRKIVTNAEGMCTIAFQGGEPTLCGLDFFRKVVQFANHFNKKRKIQIDFTLQTNGFGITEEWCAFFKENHFLIGLSVDGTKEIHDSYRHCAKDRGPTYDRIMQTAAMFDEYGVEYNILTVVHRETAEHIGEIYQAYKERGFRWQQYITCLDPLGEERGKAEYSLLPETYGKFLNTLFDLWYEDFKEGQQPFIRQFDNYVACMIGYPVESCEQRGMCGVQYVVEADGSVYPCDFYVLDEYRIGNFNTDTLQQINDRTREMKYLERSMNHPQKCKACKYFRLCRGGCYRSRLEMGEDEAGKNYFCEGYYAFFEHCAGRLEEIGRVVLNSRR